MTTKLAFNQIGGIGRTVDLVEDFGADPAGATAINTIWATAMETFSDGEGGRLIIPNGNFLVTETYRGVGDLDLQLDFPYDNVIVELQGNLVIENTDKRHCCLLFGRRRGSTSSTPNRVSNIRLTGTGSILGNTAGRTATSQWSSGVYVSNCIDSMIDGITIKNFFGENIYCDALPYGPADGDNNNQSIPQSVSIVGVNMYGGYRNNVSVQNSESIKFISVTANDSIGSAPQAGFNIEPTYTDEPNGYYCRDISFIGCTANGNAGSGMEIVDTDAGTIDNIYVGGSTFRDNGTSSNGFGGIRVVSSDGEGSCRIIGNEVIGCYGLGIDHEGAGSGGVNAGRRVIIANNFVSGILEGTKSATQIGHGIGCRDGVVGTIVTGNIVEKCAHHGIWIDNTAGANQDIQVTDNSVYSNSQQTDNTYDNIHVSSGNTLIDVTNNHVREQIPTVPVTNTAQYGVNVLSDFCRVEGNDVYTGGQTGNINYSLAIQAPDDGSRNGIVKSNAGYVNETMFRTNAFSVASTGAADIVIAHGLDTQGLGTASTAARVRSQISLTVIDEGTLTGDPVVIARVKDLDATNLTIRYNVTTAGSAGDQCRIAVKVNPPSR